MSETRQESTEKLTTKAKSPVVSTSTTHEKSTEPEVVQGILKYEEPAPTYYDYQRNELQNTGLFKTMLTLDEDEQTVDSKMLETPSILIKSFGMRNLKSLQDALNLQEQLKLQELYRRQQQDALAMAHSTVAAEEKSTSTITTPETSSGRTISSSTLSTETDLSLTKDKNRTKKHLEYLMGLETLSVDEEGMAPEETEPTVRTDEFHFSTSKSMKTAQKYLKIHRIFDLFQFVTAHLLSTCPDDPIKFILEILNKCLLYRSRLCSPPLLYDKQHLEQMFNLMDRIGSGGIDLVFYEKAMKTLGICEYNRQPLLTEQKTVDKETFVNEAYIAELALFDDMIKVKCIKKERSKMGEVKPGYPSETSISSSTSSDGQLMPSDFMLGIKEKSKKKKKSEMLTPKLTAAEEELEG